MSTLLPKEKINAHVQGVVSFIEKKAASKEMLAAFHRGHDFEALLEKMPDLRSHIAKGSSHEVALAFGGGMIDPEGDGVGEVPFPKFWWGLVKWGTIAVSAFLVAAAAYMSYILPAAKVFMATLPYIGVGLMILGAIALIAYRIDSMRRK